jgi:hypothetical protein
VAVERTLSSWRRVVTLPGLPEKATDDLWIITASGPRAHRLATGSSSPAIAVNGGVLAVKAMPLRGRPPSSLDSQHPTAQTGQYEEEPNRRSGQVSVGRHIVGFVNPAEHWRAWLDRYGEAYSTDEERRAAYRDFKANLAVMTEVFSADDDHDNP